MSVVVRSLLEGYRVFFPKPSFLCISLYMFTCMYCVAHLQRHAMCAFPCLCLCIYCPTNEPKKKNCISRFVTCPSTAPISLLYFLFPGLPSSLPCSSASPFSFLSLSQFPVNHRRSLCVVNPQLSIVCMPIPSASSSVAVVLKSACCHSPSRVVTPHVM